MPFSLRYSRWRTVLFARGKAPVRVKEKGHVVKGSSKEADLSSIPGSTFPGAQVIHLICHLRTFSCGMPSVCTTV